MIDRRSLAVAMGAAALGLPCTAAQRAWWSGRSGGLDWEWSARDFTARRPDGHLAYSARASFAEFARLFAKPDNEQDTDERVVEVTVRPLSLVGPLVTLQVGLRGQRENVDREQLLTTYQTLDLRRPIARYREPYLDHVLQPTSILNYFPEHEVLAALLDDSVVRETLKAGSVRGPFRTAQALLKALAGSPAGEGGAYTFAEDTLHRFAFHHLGEGRVAVRLPLSHLSEVAHGLMTQVGLSLRVPASLAAPLRRAATGSEGFLAQAAAKRFGDRQTVLRWRYRKGQRIG